MSVFISYSHEDSKFVDKLCDALVKERIYIWLDKWELNVGDSITSKVQNALTEASYLCVVLSAKSVSSDWCKRELNAGLIREIEEKRVVVLPILIDNCEIPLFLRDKLYADFRKDFNLGLNSVITALSKLNNRKLGRIDKGDYVTDMAIHWGERKSLFELHLDMVSFKKGEAWSVLTTIIMIGDPALSEAYMKAHKIEKGEEMIDTIFCDLMNDKEITKMRIKICDDYPVARRIKLNTRQGDSLIVDCLSRRLGEDSGRDILYDLGQTVISLLSLKKLARN